jgi:formylglycine-generating enzyme required for sulfatase activity
MNKKNLAIGAFLLMSFQTTDAAFEGYTQKIPCTQVTFDMVPIPAGTFMMGSDQSKSADEKPTHEVTLDAFWMGTHEVTWDSFELFLDKNYELAISEGPIGEVVDGLTRPSMPYLDMTFNMGKEGMPAIGMTQYGAIQFCHWLYLKTGMFYRLPTEAEWEYAAKAGSQTPYFFGSDSSDMEDYAWTRENSGEITHKGGKKKPNPWGLYDIYGNVLEWTSDQYDSEYYANSAKANPTNPSSELYPRVVRGGSYDTPVDEISSTKRFESMADWKRMDPQIPKSQWWFPEAPFLGLRLVRPLIPPSEEDIKAYYTAAPITDY